MCVRCGEMAAEVERLQGLIDAANAQEPEYFVAPNGEVRESAKANDAMEWGARFKPLYSRPIPAQQSCAECGDDDMGLALYCVKCIDSMEQSPAVAVPVSRDVIREVFTRNGFTIKEGQSDLKDYVFNAAYDLLAVAARINGTPVAVPDPSEIDVYRWFQESTIAHHVEEDGGHISKRAMFLAKKAISFAQQSPRITEQEIVAPKPGKCCSYWRNDAIENSAEIADRHSQSYVAQDIRNMKSIQIHDRITNKDARDIAFLALDYKTEMSKNQCNTAAESISKSEAMRNLLNKLNGDRNGK